MCLCHIVLVTLRLTVDFLEKYKKILNGCKYWEAHAAVGGYILKYIGSEDMMFDVYSEEHGVRWDILKYSVQRDILKSKRDLGLFWSTLCLVL